MTFTCRFTWERALRESDLTATQRLICYTIATWADLHTGVIPEKWTPSISRIAKAAGLDPSTVKRNLPRVVEAGWLAKTSPSLEAARTRHARNQYRLALPAAVAVPDDGVDRAGRTVHQARDTTAEAGRTAHQGWAHRTPKLGAQRTTVSPPCPRKACLSPTRARLSPRSWPPRRDDRSMTNGPRRSRSRSSAQRPATWLRPSPTSPRRSGARPTTAP